MCYILGLGTERVCSEITGRRITRHQMEINATQDGLLLQTHHHTCASDAAVEDCSGQISWAIGSRRRQLC